MDCDRMEQFQQCGEGFGEVADEEDEEVGEVENLARVRTVSCRICPSSLLPLSFTFACLYSEQQHSTFKSPPKGKCSSSRVDVISKMSC